MNGVASTLSSCRSYSWADGGLTAVARSDPLLVPPRLRTGLSPSECQEARRRDVVAHETSGTGHSFVIGDDLAKVSADLSGSGQMNGIQGAQFNRPQCSGFV